MIEESHDRKPEWEIFHLLRRKRRESECRSGQCVGRSHLISSQTTGTSINHAGMKSLLDSHRQIVTLDSCQILQPRISALNAHLADFDSFDSFDSCQDRENCGFAAASIFSLLVNLRLVSRAHIAMQLKLSSNSFSNNFFSASQSEATNRQLSDSCLRIKFTIRSANPFPSYSNHFPSMLIQSTI